MNDTELIAWMRSQTIWHVCHKRAADRIEELSRRVAELEAELAEARLIIRGKTFSATEPPSTQAPAKP